MYILRKTASKVWIYCTTSVMFTPRVAPCEVAVTVMLYVPAGVPWKIVCVLEPVVLLPHADAMANITTTRIVAIPAPIEFTRSGRALERRNVIQIVAPIAAASSDINAIAIPV